MRGTRLAELLAASLFWYGLLFACVARGHRAASHVKFTFYQCILSRTKPPLASTLAIVEHAHDWPRRAHRGAERHLLADHDHDLLSSRLGLVSPAPQAMQSLSSDDVSVVALICPHLTRKQPGWPAAHGPGQAAMDGQGVLQVRS